MKNVKLSDYNFQNLIEALELLKDFAMNDKYYTQEIGGPEGIQNIINEILSGLEK